MVCASFCNLDAVLNGLIAVSLHVTNGIDGPPLVGQGSGGFGQRASQPPIAPRILLEQQVAYATRAARRPPSKTSVIFTWLDSITSWTILPSSAASYGFVITPRNPKS